MCRDKPACWRGCKSPAGKENSDSIIASSTCLPLLLPLAGLIALLELTGRSVYLETSSKTKPAEVKEVGRRDGKTIWRIDIPNEMDQRSTQLSGKTANSGGPGKIQAAIDPKIDFTDIVPIGRIFSIFPEPWPARRPGGCDDSTGVR